MRDIAEQKLTKTENARSYLSQSKWILRQ